MQRRSLLLLGPAAWALAASSRAVEREETLPYAPRAAPPPGYAPDYAATVRAAENEGRLVVYSTTDLPVAQPLIDDFRALYPRLAVEYEDLGSTELHHRFVAETSLGTPSADVVWSSAMDQQARLVELGYALTHESPETAGLPDWAHWRDQAFGISVDPVAIAYDRRQVPAAEVPRTRADLARLLQAAPERFRRKVISYDIEKSGVGFLLASQDAAASMPGFQALTAAFGRVGARFALTTEAMLRQLASGRVAVAYNVLGAYAAAWAARGNASIGLVFPQDGTLVVSRLLFINRRAAHPNAARLWVDYLLSRRGQTVLAERSRLYAVRGDIPGERTLAGLQAALGASLRPVPMDAALTRYASDPAAYRDFILQWRRAVAGR